MDLARGLVSALLLTVWGVTLVCLLVDVGWIQALSFALASAVCIWWWFRLPPEEDRRVARARNGRGAPPVRRRPNRFLD